MSIKKVWDHYSFPLDSLSAHERQQRLNEWLTMPVSTRRSILCTYRIFMLAGIIVLSSIMLLIFLAFVGIEALWKFWDEHDILLVVMVFFTAIVGGFIGTYFHYKFYFKRSGISDEAFGLAYKLNSKIVSNNDSSA